MSGNLFDLIRSRIPSADKSLIETAAAERISYGEMLARSGRLAHALVRRGVKPGDRVAVQVEKTPDNLLLFLASIRAGAVYLPLNAAYTIAELDYFIGDAEPTLVVCDPAKREGASAIAQARNAAVDTLDASGRGSLTDLATQLSPDFADVPREQSELAAILYTSGTTGRSKGAMLSHRNLSSNADVLASYWRFTAGDVLLHALPLYHTHGLFTAAITLMLAGGTMLFLPKFDADEVIRLLPKATAMMGVPTYYTRLLQHRALTRGLCAHMRLFTCGSAPLLAETHREFSARTGHAIIER